MKKLLHFLGVRNILSLLLHIKEQNNQILSWIDKQHIKAITAPYSLPTDLPVTFPMKDLADIEFLEEYLSSDENLNALVRQKYIYIFKNSIGPKINCLKLP